MATVQDILKQYITPATTDLAPLPNVEVDATLLAQRDAELRNKKPIFPERQRTDAEVAADSAISAGTAAVTSLMGIATLASGMGNQYGGYQMSRAMDWINRTGQSFQSSQLNNSRARYAERMMKRSQESKAQYEKEGSTFVAGLKRFGRDAINSVSELGSEPVYTSDVVASGVGSLLSTAPVSAGLTAIGKATVGRMGVGFGERALADKAAGRFLSSGDRLAIAAREAAPTAGAVGLIEGGSSYSQTMSEAYAKLADRTDLTEDQKISMANQAALEAAAMQGPASIVTGLIASKLEAHPLKANNVRATLANIGKETVEEGLQSASGSVAQNVAMRRNVDPNQDILEGLGEQTTLGAVGGLGSAGIVQAPGLALRSSLDATAMAGRATMRGVRATANTARNVASGFGSIVRPIYDGILARGDEIIRRNEAASPVSDETMRQTYDAAIHDAPVADATIREAINTVDAPEEIKAEGNQFVDKLMNTFRFDPSEVSEDVQNVVSESTDRLDAINKLADAINQAKDDDYQTQLVLAANLHNLIAPIQDLQSEDPTILDNIPKNHPANQYLDDYMTVASRLQDTPKIARAQRAMNRLVAKAAEEGSIAPVEDAQVDTPAGRQMMQATLAVAQISPEKGNPEANNKILFHADNGKIVLSDNERNALLASSALVQAQRDYDERTKELDLRPSQIVSKDIQSYEGSTKESDYSTVEHLNGVLAAKRAGNNDLAQSRLNRLMLFAQHMQNKVGAINEHLATGKANKSRAIRYNALNPRGQWFLSPKGLSVNPYAKGSVEFAQRLAVDAEFVAGVANNLATIFPELNVEHVEPISLDASLNGPAETVVDEYRKGIRKVPDNEVKTPQPETKSETVEPEPSKVEQPQEPEPTPQDTNVEEVKSEQKIQEKPEVVSEPEPVVEPSKPYDTLKSPRFREAYRLPKNARSRTIGDEAPLETVRNALKSARTFSVMIGSDVSGYDNEQAVSYRKLMGLGDSLIKNMNNQLEKFISKRGDDLDKFITYPNGKALALVDENGQYHPELQQSAVLAALQWLVSAKQYQSIKDEQDVANISDIPQEYVTDPMVKDFNKGLMLVEAKRSLAQKIQSYWGLSTISSAPLDFVEGIPEAIAAEILQAMTNADVFDLMLDKNGKPVLDKNGNKQVLQINLNESDGLPAGQVRTINQYVPVQFGADTPIGRFPDAIELAVKIDPERTYFIGAPSEKIATNQMGTQVPLTDSQKEALKYEQSVPFYVNQPMVDFYNDIGLANILKIFANGDIKNENNYNVNHYKTIEGQNRTIESAFYSLQNLIANVADDQTPIYYAYNFSRVNRMQMLGTDNPQASKLVREAILPTRSTVDLSDRSSEDFGMFTLALAQALGVKVHTMTLEKSSEKVFEKLANEYKPAVEALRGWLNNKGDFPVDTLNGLEEFVELHALMEYARYLNQEDKSKFTTSLYVEADGVTNGPVNAMVMMTPGRFTLQGLRNMAKGGLFFGSKKTMNEHRAVDKNDLYTETTNNLSSIVADLRADYANDSGVSHMLGSLMNLMDLFLGDDVNWDGKNLTLGRGIAKNPLTITLYGSGAKGIAGNIAQSLMTKIYEKMSEVLQSDEPNTAVAMFGGPQDIAEKRFEDFKNNIDILTSVIVVRKKGRLIDQPARTPDLNIRPKSFSLSKEHMENLQQNMLTLFVEPLREAISETVGHELTDVLGTLRDVTQVQSIFYQYAFQREVERALEKKDDNAFLSLDEIDEIKNRLRHIAPMVSTPDQNYLITGTKTPDIGTKHFGQTLDDKLRTPAFIDAPSNAGVAGVPFTVIGSGDGMMMLDLSKRKVEGLKIFDGMNLGLKNVNSGSLSANEAVYKSWMNNPLKNVADTFNSFMKDLTFKDMSDEQRTDLVRSLFDPTMWNKKIEDQAIFDALKTLQNTMNNAVLEVQARHNVMERVQLSVDQMAAAGQSFENEGDILLEGLSENQIVNRLNNEYEKELAKLSKKTSENISNDLKDVGRLTEFGARELSYTAIKNLVRNISIPQEQKEIYNDIIRSLTTKNYKVVFGSPEQVRQYAEQNGTYLDDSGSSTQGLTDPSNRVIYLYNPSSETLLHELVHAATFDKVNDYYNGQFIGSVEEAKAVERIDGLMDQFMRLDSEMTEIGPRLRKAYADAKASIQAQLRVRNRAAAVNEFMAWGLSNSDLVRLEKRTPALVQLATDIIDGIKRLVFGRKKFTKPLDDMFTNLRFNTNILLRSQPSVQSQFNDTILYQNTTYGDNDRLTKIGQTFKNKIVQFVGDRSELEPKTYKAIQTSARLTNSINAHGFPMTMQEKSTFQFIVAALATEAQIDPNALTRVQDLYSHVVKNLKVEDFMDESAPDIEAERYYASEKLNALLGNYLTDIDEKDRSTLLPSFLGLAVVSDEFRNILSKMEVPKSEKLANGSVDNILENVANSVMDSLSARASGEMKAPNIRAAIDNLAAQIVDVAQDRQSFMEKVSTPFGSMIDRANEKMIEGMDSLSTQIIDRADKLEQTTDSKLLKNVAQVAKLIASLTSEEKGYAIAEGLMSNLNQTEIWKPVYDIINDLIGRTDSNAPIYDMIKQVRAMVSQIRQQYREHLPTIIAGKYSRKLEKQEWTNLYRGLGKTDLAGLRSGYSVEEIMNMLRDPNLIDTNINDLELRINDLEGRNAATILNKAKQLAHFMNTGNPGNNLLRNAYAVSNLFGEIKRKSAASDQLINMVDQLVSLYAYESLHQSTKDSLSSLVQNEAEGVSFTLNYLIGQRAEETRKETAVSKPNSYKGYIPTQNQEGVTLLVAEDSEIKRLTGMSFVRVANYGGSNLDRSASKGYYFAPVNGQAMYNQGINQNVRMTASGVDLSSGFTHGMMTAGRITDLETVTRIERQMKRERGTEPLLPVYGETGLVVAYERSIDPKQIARLNQDTHLAKIIGVWRGRQAEEILSDKVNEKLIDNLHDIYTKQIRESSSAKDEYIDLFDPRELKKDPVLKDAVNLINPSTRQYITEKFGDRFWVRRDMLNDAFGYRSASVGDMWTGNSRWSHETQARVTRLMIGMFGDQAYKYVMNTEKFIQNFVTDARVTIVIRSVVVPVTNMIANVYQLIGRGVPLNDIIKGAPKKIAEVDAYGKSRIRQIEAEAELRAATGDVIKERKLKAEIQSITDSHKRMTIWPLIQAGEFSSISDAGISRDEILMTEGKLSQYIENLVHRLPESVRTMGRYAIITKDTALFQGLQKSVEYGDFIAKALVYDDLTKRQKKSSEHALARVTEEFVNYDRLPGRDRGFLESVGLLWFWNFKIRSAKIAVSMMRNNPVHTLLATLAPTPTMFGSVGLPTEDNIVSVLADGRLDYSMGPGQGFRSFYLNPWANVAG